MKRLFIENDENLDFSRIKSYLEDLYDFKGNPADFFDETFTEATFNSQDAWEAIKRNDEIFAESSLIDMMGISGGLLFNNMMHMAIKENVVGKKVHFFSSKDSIWWDNLNADLFEKAFEHNELYTHEGNKWEKVDISEILKKHVMLIKLKKAKTCDGCRASEGRNECSIGYQCKDWIPLDKCPKPKTYRQLIDAGKKPL